MSKKVLIFIKIGIVIVLAITFYFIAKQYDIEIKRLDDLYDTTFDPIILDNIKLQRLLSRIHYYIYFELLLLINAFLYLFVENSKLLKRRITYTYIILLVVTAIIIYLSFSLSGSLDLSWLIHVINVVNILVLISVSYRLDLFLKRINENN